jgi:adenine deaminase
MALAVRALIDSGGGYVAACDGQIQAQVTLPVAGILAARPVPELAREFRGFVEVARQLGITENPIGLLASLPLPVVPRFRPTDMGLVDVDRQTIIPAFEFDDLA